MEPRDEQMYRILRDEKLSTWWRQNNSLSANWSCRGTSFCAVLLIVPKPAALVGLAPGCTGPLHSEMVELGRAKFGVFEMLPPIESSSSLGLGFEVSRALAGEGETGY